jgi:hypothetical protein
MSRAGGVLYRNKITGCDGWGAEVGQIAGFPLLCVARSVVMSPALCTVKDVSNLQLR